jgi:hypothetical protein
MALIRAGCERSALATGTDEVTRPQALELTQRLGPGALVFVCVSVRLTERESNLIVRIDGRLASMALQRHRSGELR